MTIEAINDFAEAVQADETMAQGLAAAIGQKQGGDAAEAFAAYARKQGFGVTRGDAVKLQMAAHASEEDTLSDDELEGIAGGNFFRDALGFVPGMMVAVGTLAGAAIDAVIPKKY